MILAQANIHRIIKMKRFQILLYFFVILTFASCNQKFDKTAWNIRKDFDYPNRALMVDDLLKNYKLKGITINQLFDLLGKTEIQNNEAYYNIITDYGTDIDPVYTKNLEFTFNEKGRVEKFKIKEWEH